MKSIHTVEAVGHVLCHDITRIIKGTIKDTPFRKGHIVTNEDIPVLLSLGKDHLFVWEADESVYHENEAAQLLATMCGTQNMRWSEVREGKIDLYSTMAGYFLADTTKMSVINGMGEMMIATRRSGTPVKVGDKLAGTRVIPLVIKKEKLQEAIDFTGDQPLLEVKAFGKKVAGIVTTGNEVFYGRIQDAFGPVIRDKLAEYDIEVMAQKIVGDNEEAITQAILDLIASGADLIICTGGMSVDPDDQTPSAIKKTNAQIVSYGAPVLPGAMFLMAYTESNVAIMGLPGCVMYAKRTIFDLVLPRVLADVPVTKEWLAGLGNGGLCLNCAVCTYPNCGFGK